LEIHTSPGRSPASRFSTVAKQRLEEPEKAVLADLLEFIKVHDPDVILFSMQTHGSGWVYSQKGKKVRPESKHKPQWQVQSDCILNL
jgi:hypothetical protein